MKKLMFLFASMALMISFSCNNQAQTSAAASAKTATTTAEASMKNTPKDVVDIAIGSADHTTLVAAVKAAGLVETLKSEGPFTIFAPTNAAFASLPEGTVASLLEPANKSTLTSILTYHVISGQLDAAAVVDAIKKGNGMAEVKTIQGGILTAMLKDGAVWLKDEKGSMAQVTATDLKGSNGIIHVINGVVLPK